MTRYALPPDTLVFPASSVNGKALSRISAGDGDWIVSRPRSRKNSRVVDEPGALLLEEFRTPASIAEAVLRFSERKGLVPDRVLDESFGFLSTMIGSGFLVEEGAVARGSDNQAAIHVGADIGSWRVTEILQTLEDTAVAVVRGSDGSDAVLKVVFPDAPGWVERALPRELAALRLIEGPPAPTLLDEGTSEIGRWLVTERLPGIDVLTAAAQLRRPWAPSERGRTVELAVSVAEAYAALHARRFLHGDVHPRNVLVDHDNVRLVDFGLAVDLDRDNEGPKPRGGLIAFYSPEAARAALEGQAPPPPTLQSEIAAIGALLFRVFTGEGHVAPTLVERSLLERLARGGSRRFVDLGLPAQPEVEDVLGRCLDSDPDKRPGTIDDVVAALASARPRATRREAIAEARVHEAAVERLLGPGAADRFDGPTASLAYGAAGAAVLLLRASESLRRPDLLAAAERLLIRPTETAKTRDPKGFHAPEIGIDEAAIGDHSAVFGAAGVHYARALVASAATDTATAEAALADFLRGAPLDVARADLMTGRAGLLLACAHLVEWMQTGREVEARLLRHGDRLAATLTVDATPDALPLVGTSAPYLGIAHGTGGVLFALLAWSRVRGVAPDGATLGQLSDLAGRASGRAEIRRWPRKLGGDESWPGWCHGSAGFALLWSLAYETTGDGLYLDSLLGAARDAAERANGRSGHLCCGDAGRAYAQLAAFRATGDATWIDRARRLLATATGTVGTRTMRRDSLLKGDLGVAALELDLLDPERASFPVFELPR